MLSVFLAFMMVITLIPATAYADEAGTAGEAATIEASSADESEEALSEDTDEGVTEAEETPSEDTSEGVTEAEETPSEDTDEGVTDADVTPSEDSNEGAAEADVTPSEDTDEDDAAGTQELYPAFTPDAVEIDGVKIIVEAPEGVFPEGAILSVEKVPETEQEAADSAVEEVRSSEKNVAVSYTYDIKVLDADGVTELEPSGEEKVKVSFIMPEVADENLEANIYHITENETTGDLSAEKMDIVEEDEALPDVIAQDEDLTDEWENSVTVETDGFSYYTVEFTYDNLQYILTGNSEVALTEILQTVGLIGEATAVEVSNSELFSASDETGEWIITSHEAFSTTEWMKVTINDIVYEITVTDAPGEGNSYYINEDGEITEVNGCGIVNATVSVLDESQYEFWVVNSDVTCASRISVKGDVKLILGDGYTLTLNKGIELQSGAKLTIYRQQKETGKLAATSKNDHKAAITVNEGSELTINGGTITAETYTDDAAGIGGDNGKSAGTITINNGTVTARSDMNAAGIGGGKYGSGGTITINDGTVTAKANDEDGAGIGGGQEGSGGTITINGGTVTATGTDCGAGIGGAGSGDNPDTTGTKAGSGTIKITDGTITAKGGTHGAGIGGGNRGDATPITIEGGTIEAKGGEYAAGIGAGGDGSAEAINITGGTIVAWGGKEAAGIGCANKGTLGTISITDGAKVYAVGGARGAGIGTGDGNEQGGTYKEIFISGEGTYVEALGGEDGAGIGTGNEVKVDGRKANPGMIRITDEASVYAAGGLKNLSKLKFTEKGFIIKDYTRPEDYTDRVNGAGIGGGDETPSGKIIIKNSKVRAYGGKNAAAIGSGDKAEVTRINEAGNIEIDWSDVEAWGGCMRNYYDQWEGKDNTGGAGIGSGHSCGSGEHDYIWIDGGRVIAVGSTFASGIGGGDDSGFGRIVIKGGADVKAWGGKHGAGIGSGDLSAHKKDTNYRKGRVEIEDYDTKVTANMPADDIDILAYHDMCQPDISKDAAGIGGGEHGYGCKVTITNVGGKKADGTMGTGYVRAMGGVSGAGIGGGDAQAFEKIEITNSNVAAIGGFGAGIGTGASDLWDGDPSHVQGGDIYLTNSQVQAQSLFGGAGIGGGVYGRADKIVISGGMTTAQGGQMGGPGTQTILYIMQVAFEDYFCDTGLGYLDDVTSGLKWYEGSIAIVGPQVLRQSLILGLRPCRGREPSKHHLLRRRRHRWRLWGKRKRNTHFEQRLRHVDLGNKKVNNKINIDNIGLYGLALSCDKRFLYYSPVKSNKLYSVSTFYLQEERTIRDKDIQEYDKKTAGFEFISSARGLFYYTSIEENSILVNFYERIFSFENLRSIRYGEIFDKNVPVSIAFNGTSGYLYYLVNRHNIFVDDNLEKELDINQNNFFIYKVKTNDRSYLYPCNIYSYIPNSSWIFIIGFALLLSYFVLNLIQFIVKLSPKEKEITEHNEEELAYLEEEK